MIQKVHQLEIQKVSQFVKHKLKFSHEKNWDDGQEHNLCIFEQLAMYSTTSTD
jgi:hypothetical protein